jgi:hypothetical protein
MSLVMIAAISAVAKSMEDIGVDYVIYRDHGTRDRLVVLVESSNEEAILLSSLHRLGARSLRSERGMEPSTDLVLPGTAQPGEQSVEIVMKAGSGKSGIPTLLWRAATSETALAAEQLVREQ